MRGAAIVPVLSTLYPVPFATMSEKKARLNLCHDPSRPPLLRCDGGDIGARQKSDGCVPLVQTRACQMELRSYSNSFLNPFFSAVSTFSTCRLLGYWTSLFACGVHKSTSSIRKIARPFMGLGRCQKTILTVETT